MVVNSDVLPRHGFTQMAHNMRCQLYFPFPTEQVVLLRTGVLVHINAYMRSLGLTPPAADPAATSPALPQHTRTGSNTDAGPLSLKARVATAGLSDPGPVQGNGVAHMADAMDVDSPGQWMALRDWAAMAASICCHSISIYNFLLDSLYASVCIFCWIHCMHLLSSPHASVCITMPECVRYQPALLLLCSRHAFCNTEDTGAVLLQS